MSMRLIIRTGPAETVVVGAMGTSFSTAGPRCSVSVLRRVSWGADAADDTSVLNIGSDKDRHVPAGYHGQVIAAWDGMYVNF